MPVVLRDGSPESVLATIERIAASPDAFSAEFDSIELGDWAAVHVYLPITEQESAITPPFMEAFLELQRQLYQLAAQAKTGVANAGWQRRELEKKVG
jgi:hypothetical protein